MYEMMYMILQGSASPAESTKVRDFLEMNSLDEMNATLTEVRILNTHMQPKYLSKHLLNQVCVNISQYFLRILDNYCE